tara:strand:+ start:1685 stop:2122 length:438 start_codon:yes stop_codon:yes gene_type:complete
MIQIQSDCDPNQVSPKQNKIQDIVNTVFNYYKINDAEISIIFGNDQLLRKIKKTFFKRNNFTDVIAFRLNEYKAKEVEGEIYISLPRAKENAEIFKEPYKKEVSRLIIHACLHLIGFNDETKKEKIKMTKLENKFLSQINWDKII